MKDNLEKVVFL